MTRVAILKHATPKEKYRWMQFRTEWNAELREKQAQYYEQVKELKLDFGDALDVLKACDEGWERWYDKTLPDFIRWTPEDVKPIIYKMQVRVTHVQLRDEIPSRTGVL